MYPNPLPQLRTRPSGHSSQRGSLIPSVLCHCLPVIFHATQSKSQSLLHGPQNPTRSGLPRLGAPPRSPLSQLPLCSGRVARVPILGTLCHHAAPQLHVGTHRHTPWDSSPHPGSLSGFVSAPPHLPPSWWVFHRLTSLNVCAPTRGSAPHRPGIFVCFAPCCVPKIFCNMNKLQAFYKYLANK